MSQILDDDPKLKPEDNSPGGRGEKRKKTTPDVCEYKECDKKLGLTAYSCRCGGYFCPLHMPSKEHDCHFDYREQAKKDIRNNNPKVEAEKIVKF